MSCLKTKKSPNINKERKYFHLMWGLFILIAIIWFSYKHWIPLISGIYLDDPYYLNNSGVFGDSFGALNTLFSGLAFAGIIISIFLQSQELKETRKELRGQKNALEKQNFEETFFQLLRLHNEIITSLNYDNRKGRACFEEFYKQFRMTNQKFIEKKPKNINKTFLAFHEDYHPYVGHYFRNLYQILKYIKYSNANNKKEYSNFIRAQLSSDELTLLFYNCISDIGSEKFKPLLEEFEFLEHMPESNEIKDEEMLQYNNSVFGKNPDWQKRLKKIENT